MKIKVDIIGDGAADLAEKIRRLILAEHRAASLSEHRVGDVVTMTVDVETSAAGSDELKRIIEANNHHLIREVARRRQADAAFLDH